MVSGEFEVLFKDGASGSLTLTIKRKASSNGVMPSSVSSDDFCFLGKNKENLMEQLRLEELRFQNSSITSFYDRPSVSYESLIHMAFAKLNPEERGRGLQAHEIAQWMCRK